jgi:hypothetical protein
MPRDDDPRVVVRFTKPGFAAVEAAAASVGVSVGGLVRECAERHAADVAADVSAGRVTIRRRSASSDSGSASAAPRPVSEREALARRTAALRALGQRPR